MKIQTRAEREQEKIDRLRLDSRLLPKMPAGNRWPRVVTVTRRTVRKSKFIDYTGEFHLELLIKMHLLPVMVPVVEGMPSCLAQYGESMDGLLLVEGEDVEPRHYRAVPANHRYLEKIHPLKDLLEMKLARQALKNRIPIFSICRGAQLLNVVCGGTLYGDVQKEKRSERAHISQHHYDDYRHPVKILPGTPLDRWYGDPDIRVNSYHHQGVRKLASRFRPMATADDGLIEAYFDPRSLFTVGLQFHPERMLSEHSGHLKTWLAFAAAVYKTAKRQA